MSFKIDKECDDTAARKGTLKIGNKRIQTPIMFHGTILNGKPEPWIYFKKHGKKQNIRGLMLNAYEIIKSVKHKKTIFENNIHDFLNFDGIVFMDSGGYLIQKKQDFEIEVEDVLEVYRKSDPDLFVSLDHPFSPEKSYQENQKNWKNTMKNYEEMHEIFPNIVPVVHGYTKKQLKNACDILESYECPVIGIGSLVPLMRSTNGTKHIGKNSGFSDEKWYKSKHFVVDSINYVRKRFPERMLHVFGIGSASTMHLMFALGVDSIDSMGWRLKAAYGAVQLPFTADRFLSDLDGKRGNRPIFSNEQKRRFNDCNCGIHQEYDYDYIDVTFEPKAIHNAYIFLQENIKAIEAITNENYKSFVNKRLERTIYKKLFKYSLNQSQKQTKLISYV